MATEHKCEIIKLLKLDTDCPYTDCEAAYYKAVEYLRSFGGIKAKIDMSGDNVANDEPLIHLSEVAYDVNMREAYEAGYEKAKKEYERLSGEWVENFDSRNDEMQASCYCSECGASCYCATDKFCHECGADMRGNNE